MANRSKIPVKSFNQLTKIAAEEVEKFPKLTEREIEYIYEQHIDERDIDDQYIHKEDFDNQDLDKENLDNQDSDKEDLDNQDSDKEDLDEQKSNKQGSIKRESDKYKTKNISKSHAVKFANGLREYGLNAREVMEKWKYAGGNLGKHRDYFIQVFKTPHLPNYEKHCVCHIPIKLQFYLRDNCNNLLVVGSHCIKKFVKQNGRTCEKCSQPHKNDDVNRCNECRVGLCDKCDKIIQRQYYLCYPCKMKEKNPKRKKSRGMYADCFNNTETPMSIKSIQTNQSQTNQSQTNQSQTNQQPMNIESIQKSEEMNQQQMNTKSTQMNQPAFFVNTTQPTDFENISAEINRQYIYFTFDKIIAVLGRLKLQI